MAKAKILILDDEALVALSIKEALSLADFEVVGMVATVSRALALAESTRPDLAICDVHLAGRRDGIQGAVLLRENLGLPVLFVTGRVDALTRARAAEAQPVGYLQKPFAFRQLIDAVGSAVGCTE